MIVNSLAAAGFLLERGDGDYFINLSGAYYPLILQDVPRKLLALPHVREREDNFFIVSLYETCGTRKEDCFNTVSVDGALSKSSSLEDPHLFDIYVDNPRKGRTDFEYAYSEGWFILTRKARKFSVRSAHAGKMLSTMAFAKDLSEHYYLFVFWNHPEYKIRFCIMLFEQYSGVTIVLEGSAPIHC